MRPTERFSDRVQDYVRYRPSYPAELVRTIERETGLSPASARVVDLGCGTGISSALFLEAGYDVTGVEPNAAMRAAALERLGAMPRFRVAAGRAEEVPLPDGCCDLIVAAQAFHWFDTAACRTEMRRLLVKDGWVALFWNDRRTDSSEFLREYEALLREHAPEYTRVGHRNWSDARVAEFFGPAGCLRPVFPSHQDLDLEGLTGRVLSSSYVPLAGQPGHDELMRALTRAFQRWAQAGTVRFEYDTRLYLGRLS